MPSAYCTSLWRKRYDLGLLQLVSSRFSNIICPKNEVSILAEYTEWPGYSINGYFLHDVPIMPSAYCTSLWRKRYDLGLLQLVSSRFSNIICPKNEVSILAEYTEWPGYSINGYFLLWWHGHIPRWQCQDSLGSSCERVVQGAWDIIFTHRLTTTESLTLTPLRIRRKLCAVVWLSHHQYKIFVKN